MSSSRKSTRFKEGTEHKVTSNYRSRAIRRDSVTPSILMQEAAEMVASVMDDKTVNETTVGRFTLTLANYTRGCN